MNYKKYFHIVRCLISIVNVLVVNVLVDATYRFHFIKHTNETDNSTKVFKSIH